MLLDAVPVRGEGSEEAQRCAGEEEVREGRDGLVALIGRWIRHPIESHRRWYESDLRMQRRFVEHEAHRLNGEVKWND